MNIFKPISDNQKEKKNKATNLREEIAYLIDLKQRYYLFFKNKQF